MYRLFGAIACLFAFLIFKHAPDRNWLALLSLVFVIALFSYVASENQLAASRAAQKRRELALQNAIDQSISQSQSSSVHAGATAGWYSIRRSLHTDAKYEPARCTSRPSKKFVLYLRPFVIDFLLRVDSDSTKGILSNLFPFYDVSRRRSISADELIYNAVKNSRELVAIGHRSLDLGAARIIASDSEWKKYFFELADAAEVIFSIPSLHESTYWELTEIGRARLSASVLMLVAPIHLQSTVDNELNWDGIRLRLSTAGWDLPERAQLAPWDLLLFDSNGCCRKIRREGCVSVKGLRFAVSEVEQTRP